MTYPLTIKLADDTGLVGDNKTNDPTLYIWGSASYPVSILDGSMSIATVNLDSDGTALYRPSLADGTYTLTATQSDGGNVQTASLTFTLDTVSPILTIGLAHDNGPSSTDHVTDDPTLSGTADPGATVDIYLLSPPLSPVTFDSTKVTFDSTKVTFDQSWNRTLIENVAAGSYGAWSVSPTLADGTYHIQAVSTKADGNSAVARLDMVLDTTPAYGSIVLADDTGWSSTDKITSDAAVLIGTSTVGDVYTISSAGSVIASGSFATSSATVDLNSILSDGDISLTYVVESQSGESHTYVFPFTLDRAVPTVSADILHDTGSSATDHITADPTLSGVVSVDNAPITLIEGSLTVGTATSDASGNYVIRPAVEPTAGGHTYTVTATSISGVVGSTSISLSYTPVDVTAKLMADNGPSSTDSITNNPTLVGTASPGAVIEVSDGAATLGSATADAVGNWTYTPAISDGTYTLVASVPYSSASVPLILDTVIPPVSLSLTNDTGSSATDQTTSQVALTGTAKEGTDVVLSDETGRVIAHIPVDGTGHWQYDPVLYLSPGQHTLTAYQMDQAGNTATASLAINYTTFFSARDFGDAYLALLPTGGAWHKAAGSPLDRIALALGGTYGRNAGRTKDVLTETFPATARELLPEWESTLALTPAAGDTTQTRQGAVAAKISASGGQSIPYAVGVAASLGVQITITEHAPFRADISTASDVVGDAYSPFTFTVNAPLAAKSTSLETLLRSYAPAECIVNFVYS